MDVVERGTERIRRGLAGQPEVQASLLDALGKVNHDLRRIEAAAPLLEEALVQRRGLHGNRSLEVGTTLAHLAQVRVAQGRFADAVEALSRGDRHQAPAARVPGTSRSPTP